MRFFLVALLNQVDREYSHTNKTKGENAPKQAHMGTEPRVERFQHQHLQQQQQELIEEARSQHVAKIILADMHHPLLVSTAFVSPRTARACS